MCKAVDRDMTIGAVRLIEKRGRPERRLPSHRRALTCGPMTLKPGREGPVRGGHPWIFSGAIASGLDGAEPGEPVRVVAASGGFVAAGYANPRTTIAVRVLTLDDEGIERELVARRVDEALALRRASCRPTPTPTVS